jgi:polyisoprenoid-binding protein YceI
MSTASPTTPTLGRLEGTWRTDPIHSDLGFSARHMVVSTFRGRVPRFEAVLSADDGALRLEGTAPVAALEFADPTQHGHIMSPDFLDLDRHPDLRFASTAIDLGDDGAIVVEGELTLRGATRPIVLRGAIEGPVQDPFGGSRLGLRLEGALDRRDFGLTWDMPLPDGGLVLGHEVQLTAELELAREA